MKFRLPEENSSGIGIAGQWFAADFGVVDIPSEIVVDNSEDIAAHGLTAEPVIAEESKRGPGRPKKDA